MLRLWITTLGFSGILSLAVAAQQTNTQLVTPNTASVNASEHLRLVQGDKHDFQLQFSRAPIGYEGWGKIHYLFQNVMSASSQAYLGLYNQVEAQGQTELHDGQFIYQLPLSINDEMLPGTWRLTKVTIVGRHSQSIISIPDNVTFEIIPSPISPPTLVHIQAPKSVTAGQRFTFKIIMDEYPKGLHQGCGLMLAGILSPVGQSGTPASEAYHLGQILLKPDLHSYEMSSSFDPDLPGGLWRGEILITGSYTPPPSPHFTDEMQRFHEMQHEMQQEQACYNLSPILQRPIRFTFNVEPAVLVTPTTATVIVNPSQIDLLRWEANRLRSKAEHIQQQLSSENMAANQTLLLKSLNEAMSDLDRTETTYKEKGDKGAASSYTQAIGVFFGDIRLNYREALKALSVDSAQARQTGPRFVRVSAVLGGTTPGLSHASEAVLASILHNAKAYDVLASSKTFYFNLDVFSEPKGATISYRKRGEEFHPLDHETDWRIENLIRAVYLIRLQKPGYEDNVVTFDAIDSTSTSINIHLKRKRGAR